jgi:hypothetical protein
MSTAVRRLCGQVPAAPSGLLAQSSLAIKAWASLPVGDAFIKMSCT